MFKMEEEDYIIRWYLNDFFATFDQKNYMKAADLFRYIHYNKEETCNKIINIIIPSLRTLYWQVSPRFLTNEEKINLEIMGINKPFPKFSLLKHDENEIPIYSLNEGNITEYDSLYINVNDFINYINNQIVIPIPLYFNIPITIELTYESYNFWDKKSNSIIDYINLDC
jgi:hypothetical protein